MKPQKKNTKQPKRGLSSPALTTSVATLATSQTGQKVLKNTLIGVTIIGGLFIGYKIYQARFQKLNQSTNQPKPNITASEARVKADNLYNAMVGFGANYEMVKAQLLGLNYNAFVMVYNAFGRRESAPQKANPLNILNPFRIGVKGMTLTEWLLDQFKSSNRLADLRALVPGNFI